jgi:hypothetical protein
VYREHTTAAEHGVSRISDHLTFTWALFCAFEWRKPVEDTITATLSRQMAMAFAIAKLSKFVTLSVNIASL